MIKFVSVSSSQIASTGRIVEVEDGDLNPNAAPTENPAQKDLNERLVATVADFNPDDVDF